MKATIRGQVYEFELDDLLDLNQLVQMKKQTGLGLKTFVETIQKFTDAEAEGIPEVLDTEQGLNALRILVWAIHLRAGITNIGGKPLNIERACADLNIVEFMQSLTTNDPDEPDAPDPTGAGPAAGPSSSKTSNGTSTTTS